MKGNKIDDLFREKLSHQKLTPPPAAWAAVEKGLPGEKKKGIYFWFSVAAGLLLICTLGWIVMRSGDAESITNPDLIAETDTKRELTEDHNKVPLAPAEEETTNEIKEATPSTLKSTTEAPITQTLVASNGSSKNQGAQKTGTTTDVALQHNQVVTADINLTEREILSILPVDLNQHLTVSNLAEDFDYSMVIPLTLTDNFIRHNEAIELAPKKKKFRVLNGIISIAKEVNSSKLSFSELRNRKNSFVNEDLKYGSKTEEGKSTSSEDENTEDEPNKD